MDGGVLGAIITAAIALVVAVGGAVRSMVQATLDHRYERRRAALIDVQDAAVTLRDALTLYGAALRDTVGLDAADVHLPTQGESSLSSSFRLDVPQAVAITLSSARGRMAVARSRVDDVQVVEALQDWENIAQVSLIDFRDAQAANEEKAFARVNNLVGDSLRSWRALARR